jgi:O-antigen/teichoic acid export membrane protein
MGVRGILIANIISNGMLFIVLLPYLLKRMKFELDFKKLKEMLVFSYPFILIALSTSILSLGDRYILTKLTDLSQVGLYSLGHKISNVLKIFVVDSFTLGLPIIGWQVVKTNSKPDLYLSRVLTYLIYILCWLGLAIAVLSKEIIHIFAVNRDYWDAYLVIPYLLLGVLFLGMQQHLFFILQIPKKTKQISYIIGFAAILNILLNLVLIPYFQMLGAAYTSIVSYLVVVLLTYVAVKKYYPVKFEIRRIFLLITLSITLFIISTLDLNLTKFFNFMYKAIIIIAFPLVLALINFYSIEEKEKIKYTLKYLHFKNRG